MIRHESGWDVALDLVFTNKQTATTVANRIQHAVQALVRDAVDASMCVQKVIEDPRGETTPEPARKVLDDYWGARKAQAINQLLVFRE